MPSSPVRRLTATWNFSSRESCTFSWPPWALHSCGYALTTTQHNLKKLKKTYEREASIYLCLKQIQIMKVSFRGAERDPWEGFVQSSEGRDTQAPKVGGPERCCFLPVLWPATYRGPQSWLVYLFFGLWFPSSSHSEMDRDSPDGKFFSLSVLIRGYEELLISTTREIHAVFFLNWTWKRNGVISAETVMLQFPFHSSGPCKSSSDEE